MYNKNNNNNNNNNDSIDDNNNNDNIDNNNNNDNIDNNNYYNNNQDSSIFHLQFLEWQFRIRELSFSMKALIHLHIICHNTYVIIV